VFAAWERLSALLMGLAGAVVAVGTGRRSDALEAVAAVLRALGLMAVAQASIVLAFYWQWGDAFTWTLPNSTWLVAALLALTQLSAFLIQVSLALPALPLPMLIAAISALIYSVVRRSP